MTIMASYLLGFVLPSIFSNTTTSDDADFFNEASVMRPRLTAAAANNKDEHESPIVPASSTEPKYVYSVTARGAGVMHYAAMSA